MYDNLFIDDTPKETTRNSHLVLTAYAAAVFALTKLKCSFINCL